MSRSWFWLSIIALIAGLTAVFLSSVRPPPVRPLAFDQDFLARLAHNLPEGVNLRFSAVRRAGESAVIEDFVFETPSFDFAARRAILSNANPAALALALSPKWYVPKNLFDHVSFAESLRFEGVTLAAPGNLAGFADAIAFDKAALRINAHARCPGAGSQFTSIQLITSLACIFDSLAATGVALKQVRGTTAARTIWGYAEIELSIREVTIDGWRSGVVGGIRLDDFRLEQKYLQANDDWDIDAARLITLDGINVSRLLPYALRGELPPVTARDLIAIGPARIEDYTVSNAVVGDMSFPEIDIEAIPFVWLIPETLAFTATGNFQTSLFLSEVLGFSTRERRRLAVYQTNAFRFDLDSGRFEVLESTIAIESIGRLFFKAQFGGAKLDQPLKQIQFLPFLITLDHLSLSFEDWGAMEKWILPAGAVAHQDLTGKETTPDDVRAGILDELAKLAALAPESVQLAGAVQALSDFVRRPGKIEIALNPPQELNLAAFAAMSRFMFGFDAGAAQLGLSAVYTPPFAPPTSPAPRPPEEPRR